VRLIHNAMNTDGTIEIRHRGCPNKSFWKISLPLFARWACSACVNLSPELRALASKAVVVEPPSQPRKIFPDRTKVDQEWKVSAREILLTLRPRHRDASQNNLSKLIHNKMVERNSNGERGMVTTRRTVPSVGSIRRHVVTQQSKVQKNS
jgi:hypothetical protein